MGSSLLEQRERLQWCAPLLLADLSERQESRATRPHLGGSWGDPEASGQGPTVVLEVLQEKISLGEEETRPSSHGSDTLPWTESVLTNSNDLGLV